MQYIDLWHTDSDAFLQIRPEVLKVFAKYAQFDSDVPESGGILLGYIRDKHLEIIEATEPTATDKRRRFFFLRRPDGHKSIAEKRWTESRGHIRYLGEWHTHPEDLPYPSCLDRSEWKSGAKSRKDKRPQLGLIVGRRGLFLELMFANGVAVRCKPVIE